MTPGEALGRLRSRLDRLAPEPGDRLPPERVLARALGCSRQTLRAALDRLAAEGAVWRHVGQGTFRGPRPAGQRVRDKVLVEISAPSELLEARMILEPPVAAAASRVATAEDVAYLRKRVEAGRRAQDPAACELADSAFHRAVAEIAANPVLLGVLAYLSDVRRRSAWQQEWGRTYRRTGVDAFRGKHSDQHDRIAQAIAERAPDRAEAEMRAHLDTVRAAMFQAPP